MFSTSTLLFCAKWPTLTGAQDQALQLPKENEMPPRDKYTIFNAHARGYRKGMHKVPKFTRVRLSILLWLQSPLVMLKTGFTCSSRTEKTRKASERSRPGYYCICTLHQPLYCRQRMQESRALSNRPAATNAPRAIYAKPTSSGCAIGCGARYIPPLCLLLSLNHPLTAISFTPWPTPLLRRSACRPLR